MKMTWMKWLAVVPVFGLSLVGCAGGGDSGESSSVDRASPQVTSIAVTPATASLPKGLKRQLQVVATYSDGSSAEITSSVSWQSGEETVATVDANGLVTAERMGAAHITAVSGTLSSGAEITVTAPVLQSIVVTPDASSVPVGVTQQLTATGIFSDGSSQDMTSLVDWASADPTIATITTGGLLTVVAAGAVNVSASVDGISADSAVTGNTALLESITVSPDYTVVPAGLKRQFTAMGAFSDGTTFDLTPLVVWQSANSDVVTVGPNGLASALAAGASLVSATWDGIAGAATIEVIAARLQSISVTPADASLPAGIPYQFTAMGAFDDGSSEELTSLATWSSGDPTVVAVDGRGMAMTLAPGMAEISATFNGISVSTTLTVTSASLQQIAVSPDPLQLPPGIGQQLTAIATYSDNSTRDVTSFVSWTAADTTLVRVSGSGLAIAVAAGTTSIKAELGSFSDRVDVTVTSGVLQSITIAPGNKNLPVGLMSQYTAAGLYSDGSVHDITGAVTWGSSDNGIAIVEPGGRAVAKGVGRAEITAKLGELGDRAFVTVRDASLTGIGVSPVSATIAVQGTKQFGATGYYSDGSTEEFTDYVRWTSGSNIIATVSHAGMASGLTPGSTPINATYKSMNSSAILTVIP